MVVCSRGTSCPHAAQFPKQDMCAYVYRTLVEASCTCTSRIGGQS